MDRASAHIRELLAGSDPGAAADAAWATSGTLHAAAAALGSRILRQAADAYDRAARAPYGRIPAPTPAGDGLRRAARLLSAYGYITSDPSFRPLVLIVRLAALAEAVADLRQTQQHAAQAASALRTAERLHAARGTYAAPAPAGHLPAQPAAALADAGFPVPPGPVPAGPHAPAPPSRDPAGTTAKTRSAATALLTRRSPKEDMMDTSDVYPDPFGEAMSYSSQRLAQLASLFTAAATVQARRKAQRNAAKSARSERALRALQDQERAAYELARLGAGAGLAVPRAGRPFPGGPRVERGGTIRRC